MCKLCEQAKASQKYKAFIDKMQEEDKARLEFTKQQAASMDFLKNKCYSSIKWPVALYHPMFDARMAYAVPANYFQNILVDGEKVGNTFAHGSMHSVFFAGDRLMLLSKGVNFKDAKEFFTSFLLIHLEKGEYQMQVNGDTFSILVDIKKPMRNLLTDAVENKQVKFNFIHESVKNRIISKERVMTSAQFKNVYGKYAGGAQTRSASIDLEGYAITVPHFAPHPFLLQLKEEFGYASNRDFQEHVIDYFRVHK